jgi:hypothetical protein
VVKSVRIGNGCGFWGDNVDAPVLLAESGNLDYLTLEYLAELTMSILPCKSSAIPRRVSRRTLSTCSNAWAPS